MKLTEYLGPNCLDKDVCLAMEVFDEHVSFEVAEHEHYFVISVHGLTTNDRVISALAVYLVGTIASCVDVNLKIRKALLSEDYCSRELLEDVTSVVGKSNDISDTGKSNQRDPWIWECMSHLILHLSDRGHPSHPPDRILAKSLPHLNVKEPGLDVIALYGTDSLGVTAGECKAYLKRPARAIADASKRLESIDDELRDAEIRQTLSLFRPALSDVHKKMLVGTFWRNERSYFPMVCFDSSAKIDWDRRGQGIERLQPPPERKFLIPLPIGNARLYFDAVAESMREYAGIGRTKTDV